VVVPSCSITTADFTSTPLSAWNSPRFSHQLRLLRNLGLVTGTRVVYCLYDNHVAQLLDQAIYHSEHLRLGLTERPETAS
jgi:hypothetical protein